MTTRIPTSQVIRWVSVAIVVATLIGGTFYGGYRVGFAQKKVSYIEGATNTTQKGSAPADFSLFWETWDLLKSGHINGPTADNRQLLYGAAKGLVQALKDPHSAFLPPEESKKFREDVRGSFGGVGMEIGIKNDRLTVIAPLKNTPADRAGLKAGDRIVKVDDTDTDGLSVEEAIQLIRGAPGTPVVLTIVRDGWESVKEISVMREIIQAPTLDYAMTADKIMHIQLYSFNENAPQRFADAARAALNGQARGVVLDMRNDPGGYLEVAVNIANWFLAHDQIIVSERFRDGKEEVFRTRGTGPLAAMPVVVLVNNGSASASEILAGALRDQRKAKLVGEKTYGKGSVQELESLSDGSTLKLTVARWVLPSGVIIEGNGLEPDIVVKITEKDIEDEKDPQLSRAIETLKNELALIGKK
ncbi:MAG: S41 family peptidase [Candidatus Liptonbacteria bacterium]|nr:S41 family peptidase [Candidatus Liptonbacteria bacterium]